MYLEEIQWLYQPNRFEETQFDTACDNLHYICNNSQVNDSFNLNFSCVI